MAAAAIYSKTPEVEAGQPEPPAAELLLGSNLKRSRDAALGAVDEYLAAAAAEPHVLVEGQLSSHDRPRLTVERSNAQSASQMTAVGDRLQRNLVSRIRDLDTILERAGSGMKRAKVVPVLYVVPFPARFAILLSSRNTARPPQTDARARL